MKYLLITIIILLCTVAYKPKCEHIYSRVEYMGAPSQPVNNNMFVCVKCYGTLIIHPPFQTRIYSTDSVFLGGNTILIQH